MKVVIVPPPLFSRELRDSGVIVDPPLGALCLATVAIEQGHDVQICDLAVARRQRLVPPRSRWHEAAADYILSLEPEIVGFGTVCSSFPTSVLVCQALKDRRPSLTTVFGGPQASLVYRDLLLEVPEVDFVLAGEADFTFTDLLGRLETRPDVRVQGLAERRRATIVQEPSRDMVDPDKLPFLNYGLWPFEEAIEKGWCEPVIPIDAGRGCPYACTFCSTSRFFRRRFRMKSPVRVAREMQDLYRRYGYTTFTLTSDTFTANRQVVGAICGAIANSEIPAVRWSCSARLDTVDRDLLKAMSDSGCFGVYFGVETGSPRMQRIIRKNLDLRKLGAVVADCVDLDLDIAISTIVGFPEEDWRDVAATVDVVLRFCGIDKVNPQVHILSPQRGTPLAEEHAEQLRCDGWFPDFCCSNGGIPRREQRFVMQHLSLCPEFCFFPNECVSRRELAQITEYASFLLSSIPGLATFLRRTYGSPLSILRDWRLATAQKGLPLPDRNGFFCMATRQQRFRYLGILLELLDIDDRDTNREVAFLTYFQCMLEGLSGRRLGKIPAERGYPKLSINRRSSVPVDVRPILSRACSFANIRYDAHQTIVRWRTRGQWRWPREKAVSYIFVNRRSHVSIAKVARATNLVARLCDGRHSIRDLLALVDCLEDPETSTLRASLGSRQLTAAILAGLCQSAGLRAA